MRDSSTSIKQYCIFEIISHDNTYDFTLHTKSQSHGYKLNLT